MSGSRLQLQRDLLARMCEELGHSNAFDQRDVSMVEAALEQTDTLLATEMRSQDRQLRYGAMVKCLREQLNARQELLRSYESMGLRIGDLTDLHEYFCGRQDELRTMAAELDGYVTTGALRSVVASPPAASSTSDGT
jgi:hypothetical protein